MGYPPNDIPALRFAQRETPRIYQTSHARPLRCCPTTPALSIDIRPFDKLVCVPIDQKDQRSKNVLHTAAKRHYSTQLSAPQIEAGGHARWNWRRFAGYRSGSAHAWRGNTGYGLPIGGVLATENAVIPHVCWVDIDAEMCLSLRSIPKDSTRTDISSGQSSCNILYLAPAKDLPVKSAVMRSPWAPVSCHSHFTSSLDWCPAITPESPWR